jgi:N4-gp56 family major capsid protein
VGRTLLIGDTSVYVGFNSASEMTLYSDSTKTMLASVTCEDGTIIYPGEAGAQGRDVYATLVFGENAYGTTEITGGGLELIVKQLGSAGTSDPLNQRATVGWKATKVTVRLVEAFMVRIETASTFDDND